MQRQGSQNVRLLLAGDAMLGRGVNEVVDRVGPTYPLEMLAPTTRQADAFLLNLECAITSAPTRFRGAPKPFYFLASPRTLGALQDAGVTAVSLANNHLLDGDVEGIEQTLAELRRVEFHFAGAGLNRTQAERPAEWSLRGQRFALFAFCDHQADFAATQQRPGIYYVARNDSQTKTRLLDQVRQLASRVDHLIVAAHWQPNWAPDVKPAYQVLGRELIEAGASVVWGHSPHHFQGVQWIDDRPVIYSSGDFLNDYAIEPSFRNDRQLIFELLFSRDRLLRLRAYPIELEYAHPHFARPEARAWALQRFTQQCNRFNSTIIEDQDAFRLEPAEAR